MIVPSKKLRAGMFLLLVVSIGVMRYFDSFLKNEKAPNGIVSFELAYKSETSQAILESWNESAKVAAGLSLGFDFLFIPIYAFSIILFILYVREKYGTKTYLRHIGTVLIAATLAAGLFDCIENFALILQLMNGVSQGLTSVAFYFAAVKFILIFLAVVFLLITLPLSVLSPGNSD